MLLSNVLNVELPVLNYLILHVSIIWKNQWLNPLFMKTTKECAHHGNSDEAKDKFWKATWTSKCTCENFQQNEDCEHIGDKVLEEVGLGVGDKDCPDCKINDGYDRHYIKSCEYLTSDEALKVFEEVTGLKE